MLNTDKSKNLGTLIRSNIWFGQEGTRGKNMAYDECMAVISDTFHIPSSDIDIGYYCLETLDGANTNIIPLYVDGHTTTAPFINALKGFVSAYYNVSDVCIYIEYTYDAHDKATDELTLEDYEVTVTVNKIAIDRKTKETTMTEIDKDTFNFKIRGLLGDEG